MLWAVPVCGLGQQHGFCFGSIQFGTWLTSHRSTLMLLELLPSRNYLHRAWFPLHSVVTNQQDANASPEAVRKPPAGQRANC
jgi:hypothetical protein